MKLHHARKLKPVWVLMGMYMTSVIIRYLCAYCFSAGATVYIDEGLYVNLARSLFYEGEVLYRAQPISYTYLLYPLTLAPLYLLPLEVNMYRLIQLWNVMMISSLVFPTYLLSKKMGLKARHALICAGGVSFFQKYF